jgi:hypothetical protein
MRLSLKLDARRHRGRYPVNMNSIPTIKQLIAAGMSRATAFRRRRKLLDETNEPEVKRPRNGLVYLPESHPVSESHESEMIRALVREIDSLKSRVAALVF